MNSEKYHPEKYWSEVAQLINDRGESNVIAGDDEPYYRYKRQEFLKLLHTVDFTNKTVLEIGSGPGGNLIEINKFKPSRLVGADISSNMIELAKKNVPSNVELVKSNGTELPFDSDTFDIVITATVLQHNTDETMLKSLIHEMCRVSKDSIIIFERVESSIKGDDLCLGRPVEYYGKLFGAKGFNIVEQKYINIKVSYLVCGFIRKFLNRKDRKEGQPLNGFSNYLQKFSLIFTQYLDKIFVSKTDVTKMWFRKK